jgi:predicted nuclease with TOPRIM domain
MGEERDTCLFSSLIQENFIMVVQRWTDEMLDELASSVTELREGITDVKDGIDGLRITSQALLQVAAQSQRDMEAMKERQTDLEQRHAEFEQQQTELRQRQAETDQRFNILLEEVRFLIRGTQATD